MADFIGTNGDDTITGTDQNDRFSLTLGNDILDAGLGTDSLTNDDPEGGSSVSLQDLVVDLAQGTATAEGFSQSVVGFESVFYSAFGNSGPTYTTVLGDSQDNWLSLEGYSGLLDGGAGDDRLIFNFISNGTMRGGDGDDEFRLFASRGGTVEGGNGIDTLEIGAKLEDVTVTRNASDQLHLSWINEESANVTLLDRIEFFEFRTGNGPLTLDYDSFLRPLQTVMGSDNGEVLASTDKVETITALGGNDWIMASKGNDHIDGGAGTDTLSYVDQQGVIINLGEGTASIREQVVGQYGIGTRITDRHEVTNIEHVTGTSGKDHIGGDSGYNHLRGLGGYDKFIGTGGSDLINGGAGTDVLLNNTYLPDSAMHVSLLRGRIWEGNGAGSRLESIEHLFGGDLDDILIGDHANNKLNGLQGDDTLMGNGGNDLIYGDLGTDTAVFGFAQDQYSITQSGDVTQVTYIGAGDGDGTDRLLNIEILRFADGDVFL